VSATSLDHVVDPERVLLEANRVLKSEGSLALWIAVVDEDAILNRWWRPRLDPGAAFRQGGARGLAGNVVHWALVAPARRLAARLRLRLDPEKLIEDLYSERMRYHFRFYRCREVEDLVARCGFRVVKQQLIEDRERGNSLFVLARPDARAS